MVTTTIVALNLLATSPLGLPSTQARAALALLWLLFLDDLDHLDGTPRQTPFDLHCHTLFLIFELFGSLATRFGRVSSTKTLQMWGHCDGSLQISLHMGPHILLQVRLQSR